MQRDIDLTLEDIHGDCGSLMEAIANIHELALYHEDDHRGGETQLRFLRLPELANSDLEQPDYPNILQLTRKGENPNCTDYVAVSYCWESFKATAGSPTLAYLPFQSKVLTSPPA
jgi:hypothetical protein